MTQPYNFKIVNKHGDVQKLFSKHLTAFNVVNVYACSLQYILVQITSEITNNASAELKNPCLISNYSIEQRQHIDANARFFFF